MIVFALVSSGYIRWGVMRPIFYQTPAKAIFA